MDLSEAREDKVGSRNWIVLTDSLLLRSLSKMACTQNSEIDNLLSGTHETVQFAMQRKGAFDLKSDTHQY